MNKKFSTLMAVFLAAGATFTAEAGVVLVKGADLANNDQVIIVNKEIPIDGSAAKVLTVGSEMNAKC